MQKQKEIFKDRGNKRTDWMMEPNGDYGEIAATCRYGVKGGLVTKGA